MVTHPAVRDVGFPHPPLTVEVEGSFACFTRPELKTERVSYPMMTPSAARGVLEAIFWRPEFDYRILAIEVLAPIRWFSIRRNETTKMASTDWVRKARQGQAERFDVAAPKHRDQRNTVCLRDVAYRIHAQVRLRPHADAPEAKYREQFRRRVERGACFSQPFLGTREFSADFGPASQREAIPHSEYLGVMLHSIDYSGQQESYRWFQAQLDNGVLPVPEHGLTPDEALTGTNSRSQKEV